MQAGLLGAYFAQQNLQFQRIYSGTLTRQRDTAAAMVASYSDVSDVSQRAGEVLLDTDWNEFDLDEVYRGITPQLCIDDPQFKAEQEELTRQMADEHSPIHRTWSRCDTTVVRAWVEGRYLFDGESFEQFRARVRRAIAALPDVGRDESIAVFTSATPIAIWIGMALELDGRKIMQLAGLMYNTAISILRTSKDEPRLFAFNGVPHLSDAELRSFR